GRLRRNPQPRHRRPVRGHDERNLRMNALTQSKFSWLLRREYWEHKGGFLWAPAIVGAVMSFFVIASLIGGSIFKAKHGIHINGARVQMNEVLSPEQQAEFASGLAQGYL